MEFRQISDYDQLEIIAFLDSVRDIMSDLVGNKNILLSDFRNSAEYTNILGEVWKEMEGLIHVARHELSNRYQEFKKTLASVGLTGKQLKYKLKTYYYFYDRYVRERTYRWLWRLLESMNVILESLSKVLPILEPVCEFKDMHEKIISTNISVGRI